MDAKLFWMSTSTLQRLHQSPSALQSRQAELARSDPQAARTHARTHALAVLDSPQSVTQSRSQADRFHRGGRGGAKKPGSKDDDKVVCFT